MKLSDKEIRFIELKAEGLTHRKISKRIYISLRYVNKLASELYKKTGTTNGESLIAWAFNQRVLKINAPNLPNKPDKAA